MSKTSGSSHALAALFGLVVGDIFIDYCRPHFPSIIRPLERMAASTSDWLQSLAHIRISKNLLAPALVAVILAFAWGMLYHRLRHR